jgi:hypothetical protein
VRAHVVKNDALAIGLIDGEIGLALEAADFLGCRGALADERDNLAIELVNFAPESFDVHDLPFPMENEGVGLRRRVAQALPMEQER